MIESMTSNQMTLQRWIVAARLFAAPASLVPVVFGAALVFQADLQAQWWLLLPAMLAAEFLHVGTNMSNDYFDFKKGVDRTGTLGGSGLLAAGEMTPRAVALGSALCFVCGTAIGLYFVALRGWPMFLLGLVGVLGGVLYTGRPLAYKYLAMGELGVFLLMGPLMVGGSYLVLCGKLTLLPFLAALPVGCMVAAILAANNLRDMASDREAGIRTLAILLGDRGARGLFVGLVLAAYVSVPILCAVHLLPWTAMVATAGLVLAVPVLRRAWSARPGPEGEMIGLDVDTAKLHLVSGILLCVGTAVG